MSDSLSKIKNSRRRQQDKNASKKQAKIAKDYGMPADELNRFNKHRAMDCGNPKCALCGNPRRTHKDPLTQQEKRLFQDLEKETDKHGNGLPKGIDVNE